MAIATIEQFRKAIGEAPELTMPQIFPTEDGEVERPFHVVESQKPNSEQGILEARLYPDSSYLVRVIYDPAYGLKAKKSLRIHEAENGDRSQKTLISEGTMRFKAGEVEIISSILFKYPGGPILEDDLYDMNNFQIKLGVFPAENPNNLPPLAFACFDYGDHRTPINAAFVKAEYSDALTGNFEQRPDRYTSQTHHLQTFYDLGLLVKDRVGHTKFEDEGCDQKWFSQPTKKNSPESTKIEGTPYKVKISHSEGKRRAPLVGRLRFSRMNTETGESWMLSVPELADSKQFMRELHAESQHNFFWKYPVVFCVKRPGEPRKWFSTPHFGINDLPK